MATDPIRPARLAVLIDADNTSPRSIAGIFGEIATIGEPSVRRIYGDFSGTQLKGWAAASAAHGIDARQNFAHTVGKNASDIALVIDAMDLLHGGRFDAFCLVTSDSDFTRLASRIREQGIDVYGFGERKTPESFRMACRRFVYTENLAVPDAGRPADAVIDSSCAKRPASAAVGHLMTALKQLPDSDGWYFLGAVGMHLSALMPDFDARTYGCRKLVTLVEATDAFDVRRDDKMVYVRPRRKAA